MARLRRLLRRRLVFSSFEISAGKEVKNTGAQPKHWVMDPYGHSVRDLARLADVTERSVRRWKVAGRVPEPYSTRVASLLTADLGALSQAWKGWSIQQGELLSPEGLRLLPQHWRAMPLQLEALHAHRQARHRFANERHAAAELSNAAA